MSNVRVEIRPMTPEKNNKVTDLTYVMLDKSEQGRKNSYEVAFQFIEGGVAMRFRSGMSVDDVIRELQHAVAILERRK